MHPALLASYATMQPRLEAEEDLRTVAALMVGTGAMKKEARNEYLRDLSRAMRAGTPAAPASAADLQAMGIRVREVPRG